MHSFLSSKCFGMDYSRWDALAADEEKEEQRTREEQRRKNKEDYMKQQQERIKAYEEQQQQQQQHHDHPTAPSSSTSSTAQSAEQPHDHTHHQHDHSHSHGYAHSPAPSSSKTSWSGVEPYRRTCGCGFTDVDALLALQKDAEANPGPSKAEKDARKVDAVAAVREHGKQLFAQGLYDQAFAVYERGVLIISGLYDLPPAEQDELAVTEVLLTLNMALCQLKLGDPTLALHHARSALQLDPAPLTSASSLKAHLRAAQALVQMGRWEEARAELTAVRERDAEYAGLKEEERKLRRMEEAEKLKERAFRDKMRERMLKEADKDRAPTALPQSAADGDR